MPVAGLAPDCELELLPLERVLLRIVSRKIAFGISEFLMFGAKEAAACVFAGSFLFLLAVSGHIAIPGLARYDFLSWSYPEHAFFHLRTVPLYSGFMYASVASYIMQAWRRFDLRLTSFPPFWMAVGLSAAIYANFFTNHYTIDVRWPLAAVVLAVFWRTRVHFTIIRAERSMPLALSFVLIGFFIWIAENIATFFGAWVYPHQAQQWAIVGPTKISSWMLLVIISFIIVAALKEIFPKRRAEVTK